MAAGALSGFVPLLLTGFGENPTTEDSTPVLLHACGVWRLLWLYGEEENGLGQVGRS